MPQSDPHFIISNVAYLTLSLNCWQCMFLQTTDESKLNYVAALRLFMFHFCVATTCVRGPVGFRHQKKPLGYGSDHVLAYFVLSPQRLLKIFQKISGFVATNVPTSH